MTDRYADCVLTWTPPHIDADGTGAFNWNMGTGMKLWFFLDPDSVKLMGDISPIYHMFEWDIYHHIS